MSVRLCIRMSMVARGFLPLALVLGCGNEAVAPPPIEVSVLPTAASLLAGGNQDFAATVANDPAALGVTWSITGCAGGAAACGSLTNVTSTTATYTAPTPVPSDAHLSITATAVADNTKSFTASLTVTAAVIAVSVSPASASVAVNDAKVFTATVANDPTNNGVTWSITGCPGGPAECGSLTNVTTTTATYTAPATVPPGSLGVTATSVTDNTKSFTATVAIAATDTRDRIAFASDRDGNLEIYVMNADGSGVTRLTNDPASDGQPAWSPDGTRIAFWSNRDGNLEVYVMNADGSGVTRLTNDTAAAESRPAWSPDGTKIAYVRSIASRARPSRYNGDIYVMNADGSGVARLTHDTLSSIGGPFGSRRSLEYWDDWPTWSPDGTKLAFARGSDVVGIDEVHPPVIYVMNADGSGIRRLTEPSASLFSDLQPAWSPNGTEIAFASDRDGNLEVYEMNADGSGVTKLTNDPAADGRPAWSPDGTRIAFWSTRDNPSADIYSMKADGTGVVRLTYGPGAVGTPAWSP